MAKLIVTYTLKKMKEGFVARCSTNDKVTAFGITETEAGDNLIRSIREYLDMYPEKRDEIFNIPTKEIEIG